MDQGLTDQNCEKRHILLPVENIDEADLRVVGDTGCEQKINFENIETVSQPFVTKGFLLEIPEERSESGGKDSKDLANKGNSVYENMD